MSQPFLSLFNRGRSIKMMAQIRLKKTYFSPLARRHHHRPIQPQPVAVLNLYFCWFRQWDPTKPSQIFVIPSHGSYQECQSDLRRRGSHLKLCASTQSLQRLYTPRIDLRLKEVARVKRRILGKKSSAAGLHCAYSMH